MTTLIKILVTTALSLLLFSCNFDMNFGPGVKGNGHVQLEDRTVNTSFNAIKANQGIDVYLTQGDEESIVVEADENILDLIRTEVRDNELHIYAKENIGRTSSKKVMVTFKNVSKITSTSGSDIFSTNTINADHLELNSSSGSDIKLEVNTNTLICNSSSGSDIKLRGNTSKLVAKASSGSDIKAGSLIAESSQVKATSGADITVNTVKELTASANSGGDIRYLGEPERIIKNGITSGALIKE